MRNPFVPPARAARCAGDQQIASAAREPSQPQVCVPLYSTSALCSTHAMQLNQRGASHLASQGSQHRQTPARPGLGYSSSSRRATCSPATSTVAAQARAASSQPPAIPRAHVASHAEVDTGRQPSVQPAPQRSASPLDDADADSMRVLRYAVSSVTHADTLGNVCTPALLLSYLLPHRYSLGPTHRQGLSRYVSKLISPEAISNINQWPPLTM